jgi:hypothetical protein
MVSFRATLLALVGVVAVSADYYIDPSTVSDSLKSRPAFQTALERRQD